MNILPLNNSTDRFIEYLGYINVYDLSGNYMTGYSTSLSTLQSTLNTSTIPNTIVFSPVINDDTAWYSGGLPIVQLISNLYQETITGLTGVFEFDGNFNINILPSPYTIVAYIQAFDSGFNILIRTHSNVNELGNYSIELDTTSLANIAYLQWGFEMTGPPVPTQSPYGATIGNFIATGPTGATGAQGPTGPAGAQGPTGAMGPTLPITKDITYNGGHFLFASLDDTIVYDNPLLISTTSNAVFCAGTFSTQYGIITGGPLKVNSSIEGGPIFVDSINCTGSVIGVSATLTGLSAGGCVMADTTGTLYIGSSAGPTGETGATGAQGPTGATGATGAQGPTGVINESQIEILQNQIEILQNQVETLQNQFNNLFRRNQYVPLPPQINLSGVTRYTPGGGEAFNRIYKNRF